jgi:hypothetical protein
VVNEFIAIENIQSVISYRRLIPTIITWNRLEGRPRTNNFDRALKAEVRDALFMLTKQWQMGEFKGDDAGSPVIAKVHAETTKLNKYKAGGNATQGFENNLPLEAKVEQRMLPFRAGDQDLSLDIRLLMGRQWLKMINKPVIISLKKEFIKAYPIKKPDPEKREDAQICAHLEAWQQYAAVAERAMDGAALYYHLKKDSNNHAYDKLTVVLTAAQRTLIDEIAEKFVVWFEKLFYQPIEENDDAWLPSKLEYQFACSAPKKESEKEKVFTAEEYYHGELDWYNLNVNKSIETLGDVERETSDLEKTHTFSFFPTPIQFDGMPNTRWWTFEDGKTNFGDIKPDTTELNKQLLIEFGLVYANDWFLAPLTLPAGTMVNLRGMAVTNVFGERIWVEPTGKASKQDWQRWNMFTLKVDGAAADEQADSSLLLLPTVPKIQESQPAEEVSLTRDEVANMVWGIETRILLPSGNTKPGREAALELKNHLQRIVKKENTVEPATVNDVEYKAAIKYQIMNTVPENWIPFIPVHVNGSNREIQLQRAAMPRIIEEDSEAPKKIQPRTKLLRFGLDQEPKDIYKLYEEEVPRSGIRVYQSYHRTRWYGGRVYNWLGVRKQVGRGEVSSGLAYDLIVPTNKTS